MPGYWRVLTQVKFGSKSTGQLLESVEKKGMERRSAKGRKSVDRATRDIADLLASQLGKAFKPGERAKFNFLSKAVEKKKQRPVPLLWSVNGSGIPFQDPKAVKELETKLEQRLLNLGVVAKAHLEKPYRTRSYLDHLVNYRVSIPSLSVDFMSTCDVRSRMHVPEAIAQRAPRLAVATSSFTGSSLVAGLATQDLSNSLLAGVLSAGVGWFTSKRSGGAGKLTEHTTSELGEAESAAVSDNTMEISRWIAKLKVRQAQWQRTLLWSDPPEEASFLLSQIEGTLKKLDRQLRVEKAKRLKRESNNDMAGAEGAIISSGGA